MSNKTSHTNYQKLSKIQKPNFSKSNCCLKVYRK